MTKKQFIFWTTFFIISFLFFNLGAWISSVNAQTCGQIKLVSCEAGSCPSFTPQLNNAWCGSGSWYLNSVVTSDFDSGAAWKVGLCMGY